MIFECKKPGFELQKLREYVSEYRCLP